jgi:hypothetical protein
VQQIEEAVRQLSLEGQAEFRAWFPEFDAEAAAGTEGGFEMEFRGGAIVPDGTFDFDSPGSSTITTPRDAFQLPGGYLRQASKIHCDIWSIVRARFCRLSRRKFETIGKIRGELHPLFNLAPFDQAHGAAVGCVGDQVRRQAELGVEGGGDILGQVFVLRDKATLAVRGA